MQHKMSPLQLIGRGSDIVQSTLCDCISLTPRAGVEHLQYEEELATGRPERMNPVREAAKSMNKL